MVHSRQSKLGKVGALREKLLNRNAEYDKIDRRLLTQNFGKKVLGDGYKGESGLPPYRYLTGTVKKIIVYETVKNDKN